jgi:undecaprenyl-diphosphatase
MEYLRPIVLAVIQGLTEFLPISSSAHLILVPHVLGWEDQGLAFDVVVHLGTLAAVLWYFHRDLPPLWHGWWRSIIRRELTPDGRLVWAVLFATIPAGLTGLLFTGTIETNLRSPLVIATTTIAFGMLLWVADRYGRRWRDEHTISWRDVVIIGLAQTLALIPGVSRSGVTITAALALGLDRVASARFSFLLSIPVIVLAGGLETLKLLQAPVAIDWVALGLATACAAASAYLCVCLFIGWLTRHSMAPFVAYRLLLGVVLLMFL